LSNKVKSKRNEINRFGTLGESEQMLSCRWYLQVDILSKASS